MDEARSLPIWWSCGLVSQALGVGGAGGSAHGEVLIENFELR
jgi:hypothetical protein